MNESPPLPAPPRSFTAARLTAVAWSSLTVITFALALLAVPISGAQAPGGGVPYPYLDTLGQFPRDFLWQYAALAQLLVGLGFFHLIGDGLGIGSTPGYRFAKTLFSMATLILLLTYYTQTSVVPVSLGHQETEGLALWIQYNPHGLFIALEELGYFLMILGLGVWGAGQRGRSKALFWIPFAAVVLTVAATVLIFAVYGINKQDRLEVCLVSIAWLESIPLGFLVARRLP